MIHESFFCDCYSLCIIIYQEEIILTDKDFRIEKDSMGELKVPSERKWGSQTQRAVENFQISRHKMPAEFIKSLALLKWSLASANSELGLLSPEKAEAIKNSALKISNGDFADEFPVDVFQTGSGTSTNMNMNEVIAHLSSNAEIDIHPNDDVNFGQSSNDVIPSSINISAAIYLDKYLLKAATHLEKTINTKADELRSVVKTGRTHLMDAMPITMAQEMGAWSSQIKDVIAQYEFASEKIQQLAIGGTAVGTGINAHPDLSVKVCDLLNSETGLNFRSADNFFQAISAQDSSLLVSATNRSLAVALTKISNDLRWMNSGPIGGLSEITLPALQPGSSIMPGKVNPVIPESVSMAASQVFGFDTTINYAAQSGNFQLNVMLPLIAYNLIESMTLLTNACLSLADKAIQGFEVNLDNVNAVLNNNPILATALNSTIGYETGAKIVKKAYKEKRTIIDVASELTDLDEETLRDILDPLKLTQNKQ